MKSSLMKLNYVSTFLGQGQYVTINRLNLKKRRAHGMDNGFADMD